MQSVARDSAGSSPLPPYQVTPRSSVASIGDQWPLLDPPSEGDAERPQGRTSHRGTRRSLRPQVLGLGGFPGKGRMNAHAPPLSARVRSPSVITGLLPRGCTLISSGGASPFTCRGMTVAACPAFFTQRRRQRNPNSAPFRSI